MSEVNEPQVDGVSNVFLLNLRSAVGREEWMAPGYAARIADHIEALATENARLKEELAKRDAAEAHYGPDQFGETAKLKGERDRAVAMLNDANRRLTALLDETEG